MGWLRHVRRCCIAGGTIASLARSLISDDSSDLSRGTRSRCTPRAAELPGGSNLGGSGAPRNPSPSLMTSDVESFIASLEHPFKREILALRAVILAADDGIAESIKWNAPSFSTSEHFATFHLRARDGVQVVLHRREAAARCEGSARPSSTTPPVSNSGVHRSARHRDLSRPSGRSVQAKRFRRTHSPMDYVLEIHSTALTSATTPLRCACCAACRVRTRFTLLMTNRLRGTAGSREMSDR